MEFNVDNIIIDKEFTNNYRDLYNAQCDCDDCQIFRDKFSKAYPEVSTYLAKLGINLMYPIEIMCFYTDEKCSKRSYLVYYAVKGNLPSDKITIKINNCDIVLRDEKIANEGYANTAMPSPYFIVEVGVMHFTNN